MSADLLPVMDPADARRLTERIRLTATTFAESRDKLIDLVGQAKAGNAHVALGYGSWTDYLADVLGDEPLRLARDDRRELVAALAAEGMSTRAIAPIVGVGDSTVQRDLTPAPSGAPAPAPRPAITGRDGKTYTPPAPKPPANVDPATGEIAPPPAPRAAEDKPAPRAAEDKPGPLVIASDILARLTALSSRIEFDHDALAAGIAEAEPSIRAGWLNDIARVSDRLTDLHRELTALPMLRRIK